MLIIISGSTSIVIISTYQHYSQEIIAVFDVKVDYSPLYEPLCELITDNSISSLLLSQALSLLDKLGEFLTFIKFRSPNYTIILMN